MIWLRITDGLPRHYHRNADALTALPPKEARHGLLTGVGELVSRVDAENANIEATLENSSGEASALLSVPPLGAAAAVMDASGELFAGVVQSVSLSAGGYSLRIEA